MTQAVLYVNEFGRASINAAAIMESAIELVFNTTDPEDIDSLTIPARIESAHASLLGIAAKLLANGMMGTVPPTISRTPAAEREMAKEVAQEVVVAFTPARVATPAPLPVVEAPQSALPVEAKPTARILELPLERPAQPRTEPQAKAKPQEKRVAPVARVPVQEAFPLGEVVIPAKAKTKVKAKVKTKDTLKRRRSDIVAPKEKLPRRLSKKEDALKMDTIVCLEDGQKVIDLGKHLETLGITPEEYQRKWGLADSYPMRAPTFIQKRGYEYEWDPVHKRMVKMS